MKPSRRIAIAAVSALTGIAAVAGVIGVSTSATPALSTPAAAPPAVAPHALALRLAAPTGSDGTTTSVTSTPNPSNADQTVNNGVDTGGGSTSFVSNSDNGTAAPSGDRLG